LKGFLAFEFQNYYIEQPYHDFKIDKITIIYPRCFSNFQQRQNSLHYKKFMSKRILAKSNEILKIEQIQVKNCIVITLKDTNFFLAKTDGEDDGDQVATVRKKL
jgi:hypothetical protein